MSDEEQIALETLKEVASDDFDTLGDDISPKMAQNILNVIDKQQKEIEEKRIIIFAGAEKVKQLEKEIEALEIIHNTYKEMIEENNYISKDKIREILKDLDEFDTTFFNASTLKEATKKSLNDLLEEN